MTLLRIVALLAVIAVASQAPAQVPPDKPLFTSHDALRLSIAGPIAEIAQAGAKSREPRDAVLTVQGSATETHAILLSPRGITRLKRNVCQFPPLRVRFRNPPGPGSVFSGQRQLKLVTHCRAAASFQQHLLLEYAAYRVYNQLTPASFRARLANIDYIGSDQRPITTRLGFFIEDVDDVAARNTMLRAVVGQRIATAQLSAPDAARVAMFQYLIGNRDWSMRAGPPGDECCHNSPLIGRAGAAAGLVPVPYDFDYSGLVNTPYAIAPDGETSVRVRQYQGLCVHGREAAALVPLFRSQRGPLLAVLGQVPLDPPALRRAIAYLDSFFGDFADDSKTARVFRSCLK